MILLIFTVDCWALLCQSHEREFQLEEPSDLLSDSRLTLPYPDNFLSSLLFFSSQSSFFFFFFFAIPSLRLFFNLIMESSAPPEQAAMLLSFSGSMCQSAGIGALVESIWHRGVELYYCVSGNMKCSSAKEEVVKRGISR